MKCFFTQILYSRHVAVVGVPSKGAARDKVGNLFRSWEEGLAGLNKISTFAEIHVVVLIFVLLIYEHTIYGILPSDKLVRPIILPLLQYIGK